MRKVIGGLRLSTTSRIGRLLLVTTVASLGWASTREAQLPDLAFGVCVFLLAASVVFGIFTLAMIPLVTEQLDQGNLLRCKAEISPSPRFE